MILLLALTASAADWTWTDDPIGVEIDAQGLGVLQTTAEDALSAAVRTWNVDGDASVALATGTDLPPITVFAGDGATADPYTVTRTEQDDAISACSVKLHVTNTSGAVAWAAEPTASQYDLEAALVQALGACLGLSTTPLAIGPQSADLASDQIAALQALYGEATTELISFTSAVLYDFDTEGDRLAAPGEDVLFVVEARNQGDPAYDVSGTLQINSSDAELTLVEPTWEFGDVPTGAQGQFYFIFHVDACDPGPNPTTTITTLTDARGDTTDLTHSFSVQCVGEVDEPDNNRKGCQTGPGAIWLAFVPLLFVRRRYWT